MQVTELSAEGLRRTYRVVVPAESLDARRDRRLAELSATLRLPGFRPGKVPAAVVRQRYGAAVASEVLEEGVSSAMREVISERGLRPALQPKVEVVNFSEGQDLEFRLDLEVLPEITVPDLSDLVLERLKATPSDADIDRALGNVAARQARMVPVEEDRPAASGDVVVCDYAGEVAEPQNLLADPALAGAAAGSPGKLPEDWSMSLPAGVTREVLGMGAGAAGRPWIDLRLAGTGAEKGQLRLFLGRTTPVPTGSTLHVRGQVTRLAGAAPEGAKLDMVLAGYDGAGTWLAQTRAAAIDLSAEEPQGIDAGAVLPGGEAASAVLPFLALAVPEGAGFDVTLRLEALSLDAGETSWVSFPGGTATDAPVPLGTTGFIPGFAEQIEGIRPGETRQFEVSFPEGYGSARLAGRRARFSVTAKRLQRSEVPSVDDDFSRALGFDDLAALRGQIASVLQREYDQLSRQKLKRALLDALGERASFPVPEGMVEAEFAQIWQRVEADLRAGRLEPGDAGKEEAVLKAEYRAIAERRIRLGLLLSEIGRGNSIQVTQEELARAMREEAARYPGQQKEIMEFFRKNPQAAENLRAPLFEEKVVDYLLELAKLSEREVTVEELRG
jgi:FKBP-type peptidyl-prolyl cis-trans isomerase (trigger factor)